MNRWPFDPDAQVVDDIAVAWDDPDYPAAGGATVTGTATGAATSSGTATGTVTVLGTAAGAATSSGTASGTVTVTGTASGSATSSGTATGSGSTPGAQAVTAGAVQHAPSRSERRQRRILIRFAFVSVYRIPRETRERIPVRCTRRIQIHRAGGPKTCAKLNRTSRCRRRSHVRVPDPDQTSVSRMTVPTHRWAAYVDKVRGVPMPRELSEQELHDEIDVLRSEAHRREEEFLVLYAHERLRR